MKKRRYPKVDSWFSINELEMEVQQFWKEKRIFEKLRKQNENGRPWSFIDGPITANNPMGIHHAWGRSLKDAFQRYYSMKGRKLRYQNGFDCQGLWVEVEVEKELGFTTKRDIENYGIGPFIEKCRDRANRYASVITDQSKRLGYWMDWDNSYYTMSERNNYTIWRFLKRCHQRKLIYRGHDVMPWCPRCGTGLSQHELSEGYAETVHTSVYAAFPVLNRKGEHLVIWTTTPWTLSANSAVAVNPNEIYTLLSDGEKKYYVHAHHADKISAMLERKRGLPVRKERQVPGRDLAASGSRYRGPFDHFPEAGKAAQAHRVIPWNDVSGAEGTGLVHIAPGCGEEDYALGKEFGLPSPAPLDENGRFIRGYGFLSGMDTAEAGKAVIGELEALGILIGTEEYRHSYPHCWRCGTELVYRLVDEWYIAMDPWREEIKAAVEKINWIPSYGKELELDWLSNMRDWMISKKRYWGLALPIWTDEENSYFEVMGSREELKERAVEGWEEFDGRSPHRPWIDRVKLRGPGGRLLSRIPDVGNPWLDAGIVPYSTTGYGESDDWKTWVPGDFVTESFPGQFRNWFYSLLAMSTMLEGIPPFRNLLGHATVKDENGREMHKSSGNAIWFDDAVKEAGADVLRWLFFTQDIRNNLNFSFKDARQIRGKFFNTIWNAHAFFVNYAGTAGFDPASSAPAWENMPLLDRWILSRLKSTAQSVDRAFGEYDARRAAMHLEDFAEVLSNWYIRHSRRRFWRGEGVDAVSAFHTLYRCLEVFCRLAAPLAPMTAEKMYRNISGPDPDSRESVHLVPFPEPEQMGWEAELDKKMDQVMRISGAALKLRKQAGIKIRQPLRNLKVCLSTGNRPNAELTALIAGEVNVKKVEFLPPGTEVPRVYCAELDLRKTGPRFGRRMPEILAAFNASGYVRESDFAGEPGELVLETPGGRVTILKSDTVFKDRIPEGLGVSSVQEGWIALDTTLDEELLEEGLLRDAVRRIQVLRKESGLEVEDRTSLAYWSDEPILRKVLGEYRKYLTEELLAEEIVETGEPGREASHTIDLSGRKLYVGISKIAAGIGDRS
ncbi:MAG: isoleucine--tRNA ligase [Spirochaetia bacterium]